MFKSISIGNYKQLQNVSVSFQITDENPTSILVGDTLSGKREVLEVIPFLFGHTPSFQDQSAYYHHRGITLHDKQNMTQTDSIDFTLEFKTNHAISPSFKYEGGTYGSWIKTNETPATIHPESLSKVKLYSFTENCINGINETCSSGISSSGVGLLSYIEFTAEHQPEQMGSILGSLMNIFPEITGALVYTKQGNNFEIGEICQSRCPQFESPVFFSMKNGMTYKITHVPMAILTSLACLTVCAAKHTSSLILIDEFDQHLDVDRAFKLFCQLEPMAEINGKQLILTTSKREFLMNRNSHYLEA
ncbi:hypothetical protein OTK49_21545 [Vibrio coralliirubri]|uniref:hypothetical protein n=1 Tax=Vibrio coralliirubri TaxID=1516159 RepID=UPI002284614A|nr:hypothetical protein [Vibrio coralliirubri]MCY9865107.1 hypothetical protein [Vibrio coralliirubri]